VGEKLEVSHVVRPDLPWRKSTTTECGRTGGNRPLMTRDELIAKVKLEGIQRAALSVCMTCLETARRWADWRRDPVQAMARETYHGSHGADPRLKNELLALAALVEAHRDEFDEMLTGLAGTISLDAARRARRR